MRHVFTRDEILRGKNLCPISRRERAQKGAKASPWSKGPAVHSKRAADEFAKRRR